MALLFFAVFLSYVVKTQKPNILFILADDLGWANVQYHNDNGEVHTPNINYLVQNGLELNRHYVHYVCSPTRSSVQSGRLPVHVHLDNSAMFDHFNAGVPPNFTCVAERLQHDAKYQTYFAGKWDAGATMMEQTPFGRGYMKSFGYLNHMNDYWNEHDAECQGQHMTDLWDTDKPAFGYNHTGEYEEDMFAQRIYSYIDESAKKKDKPFFIFYAAHIAHSPLQIPKKHLMEFDNDEGLCQNYYYNGQTHNAVYPGFNVSSSNWNCRSIYQSMVNYLDVIIGNITTKLMQNGQWNNTLIVFSADNGGEELVGETAANNYPLRGAKFVPFEGGIRVNAFVSGGYLPKHRRGKIENGRLHIADWYSTFCHLAGIDPTDKRAEKAGLPPIDSLNMWPLINGQNSTSPRTNIHVDNNTLIDGDYKFLNGTILQYASWGSSLYPNASSNGSLAATELNCENGCLFDITNDPTEHNNIIDSNMEIAQTMNEKLIKLNKGYYQNDEVGVSLCPSDISESCQCWAAKNMWGGYWGPSAYVPNSTLFTSL